MAVSDSQSNRPPPKKKTKDKLRSGEESSSSFDSLTTSAADAQDTVSSVSIDTVSSVEAPVTTQTVQIETEEPADICQNNQVGDMSLSVHFLVPISWSGNCYPKVLDIPRMFGCSKVSD